MSCSLLGDFSFMSLAVLRSHPPVAGFGEVELQSAAGTKGWRAGEGPPRLWRKIPPPVCKISISCLCSTHVSELPSL